VQEGLDRLAQGAAKPIVEPAGMRVQLPAGGIDRPRRVMLTLGHPKGKGPAKGNRPDGGSGQVVHGKGKGREMQHAASNCHGDGKGQGEQNQGRSQCLTQVWPRTT
jgi:hypothetical protein